MGNVLDITLAVVLPLLATVLTTIAIPTALAWLKANNVIKDEARAKLLQSALENAALTAIARAGGSRVMPAVTSDAAGAAVSYVKPSVPDCGSACKKGSNSYLMQLRSGLAIPEGGRHFAVIAHSGRALGRAV